MSQSLRLDGAGQTLLIGLRGGRPTLDHWGAALGEGDFAPDLLERAIPHGMLDRGEAFDLFPEHGRGFTARPALEFSRPSGAFISQMEIVRTAEAEIVLADAKAGVEVAIEFDLHAGSGVAGFRSRLTNTGEELLRLDWLSPVALPAPGEALLTFGGRWAREFMEARLRLPQGAWTSESRTGRTSHHAPPFLVVGAPGFGADHGEVVGVHLAWSGDHRLWVERLRDGRLQIQAGELFWPGEVMLAPGETYVSPWLYAARSDRGLNGLAERFHGFVRDEILGRRLRDKPRPVHFNTWEAVYFRHDLAELKQLADLAVDVGAERFVLDDGWFKGRNDDTAALGDWIVDPAKYPDGLAPLIAHVRGLGLEFGLWVEPEMANADSDLLRAHPDWVLGEGGRDQPLGRGQYVLDLTRPEVSDAIFQQLHALLTAHPIGYLKWDMNRDLTQPASGGRPASRAQVLAVYALLDRLRAAHPGVEIESCASGGARADYEVLRRTERIWTSDCNDPVERQAIQAAFALFFPPEVMGAHVGPAASHTTARRTSLELRAITALFGSFGIEADLRRFPPEDLEALKAWIGLYKRLRSLLHAGRRLRLSPSDPGATAFLVLDDAAALVSYAQLETPRTAALDPQRIAGLAPDAIYEARLLNPPPRPGASMKRSPALARGETVRASGAALASIGLPLPILRAGEAALFEVRRTVL